MKYKRREGIENLSPSQASAPANTVQTQKKQIGDPAKLYTELYTGGFEGFFGVRKWLFLLVGAPRFELGTPCTPCSLWLHEGEIT